MVKKRILIFTGGRLGEWALEHIEENDILYGADGGALFLVSHGLRPTVSLGDFDSVTVEQLQQIKAASAETFDCDPVDKDFTDTELAFRQALRQKPDQIILFGALGTRFDHSLANVHLLRSAAESGVAAAIVDEHNSIRLVTDALVLERKARYSYVSLLPLTEKVAGITLTGFQYPLSNATLEIGQSLGISNILSSDRGTITITEGMLLVIESVD
ncbi:Thiamine pyrophosphokinase [Paenibacillus plantiphilus]|uniref:Thiamine diphosphokinase n=1 Tax=Paenibacillus plantiphilus TaxID=2905650 RepID=A0ABM9BW03_9BACL|nr:thiamine diphosphokinase [Paenibacillus plantiphilus]CAH1194902.1 Thiamine pyrophosphokinase [Paenibacillus plantiphilus]